MTTKRNFQLKNISFFKSSGYNSSKSNHLSGNLNQMMRQISTENNNAHEKKNRMLFPTVSDRALSNSSHSNRKDSKISFKKSSTRNQSPNNFLDNFSEMKISENPLSSTSKTPSSQLVFTKANLYNELSSKMSNQPNNNRSRHIKSFTELSNEGDTSMKSRNNNGNMKNNIRIVLSKQMNLQNPSSLKSTSASKESNNNTNSIKIVTTKQTTNNKSNSNNKSAYNEVDDITTPEELHYYYIRTLQSGKLAETKF